MKLSISPDNKRPNGGYASLTLSGESFTETETTVSVFDTYSERHLGETGWQPEPAFFGPYTVTQTDDGASLIIGPEIVNQLEEYANLKFSFGQITLSAIWPDDVFPAAGAAIIGGIHIGASSAPKEAATLYAKAEKDTESDIIETDDEEVEPDATNPIPVVEPTGKKWMLPVGLLLLALIAAALFWFYTRSDEPIAENSEIVEPEVTTPAVVPTDACAIEAFDAIRGQGFSAAESLLRQCGGSVTPDTALGFLESGAASGEASALLMFGALYDDQVTDDEFEGQIGLSFGDVPSTASNYYLKAKEAGSTEAATRLEELCNRMANMTDTLSKNAYEENCNS